MTVHTNEYASGSGPRAASVAHDETEETTRQSMSSRLVTSVIALIVGAVYGAIGTVAHVNVISIAGLRFPLGLILAVAGVAALLLAFRLLFDTRGPALFAAIGIVGMIAIFSVTSAGGSVLIPAGTLGLVWTLAPVLVATVVIGFPSSSRMATFRSVARGESPSRGQV